MDDLGGNSSTASGERRHANRNPLSQHSRELRGLYDGLTGGTSDDRTRIKHGVMRDRDNVQRLSGDLTEDSSAASEDRRRVKHSPRDMGDLEGNSSTASEERRHANRSTRDMDLERLDVFSLYGFDPFEDRRRHFNHMRMRRDRFDIRHMDFFDCYDDPMGGGMRHYQKEQENIRELMQESITHIKRLENVMHCYQKSSFEARNISDILYKWRDYKKALEEKKAAEASGKYGRHVLRRVKPYGDNMDKLMQHDRDGHTINKIFWENVSAEQKSVLDDVMTELERRHPQESVSELRKGVLLAYNKNKWAIVPSETRRYKRHSEKSFLQEKEYVKSQLTKHKISLKNIHPLESFYLWKSFQLRVGKMFWDNSTPEKGALLKTLMAKLTEIHPTMPEETLRTAVIQVVNISKRGVRPREFKVIIKLVGKLLYDDRDYKYAEDVCSICLCKFNARKVFLPCVHSFHYECISTWLEENQSCPICRVKVYEVPEPPVDN